MTAAADHMVGVLGRRGRFFVAEPLFERGRRVNVELPKRTGAREGDIVLVDSGRRARGGGRVLERLGRPEVARDVIAALVTSRGYEQAFSAAADVQAERASNSQDEAPRNDLIDLPTFTIDPASARDFDDAISAKRDDDGVRVYVHIADVAAFVRPGSALDREAEQRGNSTYMPGAVVPMLPHALSSAACSLVPGEVRRAVTADVLIGADGHPRTAAFYRSLIRSDARLEYGEVDDVFAGAVRAPGAIAAELALAREIASAIRKRRFERGALALETSEPEFEFDAEGNVRGCRDVMQTESHWLIEELMIMANEQVAATLEQRHERTIYRVHERPDPGSVEQLLKQLESLGIPTPAAPDNLSPAQANDLVGLTSAKLTDYLRSQGRQGSPLATLALRALKQAVYSTSNIGHAGLASTSYCHFTSPIRRYPDLVVHRSVLAAFAGKSHQLASTRLDEVALHCSQTERESAELEHLADDICAAFLLERLLFEQGWEKQFEGEVGGVTNGAVFVTFGPLPGGGSCEGFLPARKLRSDWYEMNAERTALVGTESGKTIKIGDPVTVRVQSIETARGRIDLEPVGLPD